MTPSPPLPQRYLLGFMVLGLLAGSSNGVAKVVLPLYAASLHASPWQIGLVGGLQFTGMLLLSMPVGGLIDRHGSRPLFRFGGLAGAALYLLGFTHMDRPWQLIAGVVLFGLLNPFRMVATQTEFLHLLPRLGPRKAGWQRASHALGMFFVGPMLGAQLLGLLGYTGVFVVTGLGLLATVFVGDRVLSGAPPGRGRSATPLLERLRGQVGIILSRRELRQSMLIELCGQMAMSYFAVFVVLIGIREFHLSVPQAATLVTLQGAVFVLTLLLAGGALSPLRDAARYAIAFSLLLATELLLAFPLGVASLWIGAVLLGLGLGVQHLTSVNRFAALTAELGRGRVGGLFSLSGPAGGLIGAVAGGSLGQRFGLFSGFRVLAALYAVLMLWHGRGVLTENAEPVVLAEGEPE
ncbi:MFS transporter [Sorangium sp. So ce327]|uniref:MFS transporter n=1 Tax=Sorangium sp. So ce327 TaxID=3133301 RepID=UPI003F607119